MLSSLRYYDGNPRVLGEKEMIRRRVVSCILRGVINSPEDRTAQEISKNR